MGNTKRIVVVEREKCHPKKCGNYLCVRVCPRNRAGDECIVKGKDNKVNINEELCIGCGICQKKCPFSALTIVNLSHELEDKMHQFGKNTFRLYGLPIPEKGRVTGILGANGIGKTTSLKILSKQLIPNLGNYEKEVKWDEVIEKFRGTELQNYLLSLKNQEIRAVYKPQKIDMILEKVKGPVNKIIKDETGNLNEIAEKLEIKNILDRNIEELSGGELQRVAIAIAILRDGDVYYFDEPSSFLDVRHRLLMGKVIRELAEKKAVMVVEHDLATLDFLADLIHVAYGTPSVYGVISKPYHARRGINTFLDGYIKADNIRFRDESISFKITRPSFEGIERAFEYPNMEKGFKDFKLNINKGFVYNGEIIGVFGANALGKTTFARILAGEIKADKGKTDKKIKISYKPQYLKTEFKGTVSELLKESLENSGSREFKIELLKPLELEELLDNNVQELSGGELQRVAIAICLGQEVDIYLLDEASAYLDVEQRVKFAKLIRNFIEVNGKSCLIIDHDLLLLNYLSDRAIVFLGKSGVKGEAISPDNLNKGMNLFLKDLNITFRIDPETGRPRANKLNSQKDQEQKDKGIYYAG